MKEMEQNSDYVRGIDHLIKKYGMIATADKILIGPKLISLSMILSIETRVEWTGTDKTPDQIVIHFIGGETIYIVWLPDSVSKSQIYHNKVNTVIVKRLEVINIIYTKLVELWSNTQTPFIQLYEDYSNKPKP